MNLSVYQWITTYYLSFVAVTFLSTYLFRRIPERVVNWTLLTLWALPLTYFIAIYKDTQ